MKRSGWLPILLVAALLLAAGCDFGAPQQPLSPAPTPTAEKAGVLNVFNWDTYIDPEVVARFEQSYGVKVNYTVFGSLEEMLEKVKAQPADFDVVVPADWMVEQMRAENLLAPLDKANIHGLKNIDPLFLSLAYDPANRYCAPYLWISVGIGYNIKATGREIKGVKDLFDPAFAGRVALLNSPRETLGLALLYLGYSPNTSNPREVAQARDLLQEHAAQFKAYAEDDGQDLLASGEVDLVVEYSGDILQLAGEDADIRFALPEEGAIAGVDNLCIPAGSPNRELAEQFIDFVLRPEEAAAIANFVRYGSPNEAAVPLINPEDRDNPALYPPAEARERLFFLSRLDAETSKLYDATWAAILDDFMKQ